MVEMVEIVQIVQIVETMQRREYSSKMHKVQWHTSMDRRRDILDLHRLSIGNITPDLEESMDIYVSHIPLGQTAYAPRFAIAKVRAKK